MDLFDQGRKYGHAYGAALGKETYESTLLGLGLRLRERLLYIALARRRVDVLLAMIRDEKRFAPRQGLTSS
ncbi:MAG TPA: hypothetical protein VFY59_16635 [Rubrobacter sp.]|nr:hypothetical protein [Rubrobacter sp.]